MPYRSEILPNDTLEQFHKAAGSGISFQQWLNLRDRARKDLWFLFHDVLHKSLAENPQRLLCEFFVKKNFDNVYHDGYTLDDVHTAIRNQLGGVMESQLLAPRGGTKSTINCVDCVQWLLNAPDIRIFIETGEYLLARKFLREVKGYFYKAKDAKPNDFQRLFPEYIISIVDDTPFRCPARRLAQEDHTLWVNSIEASNAGWHCDLKKNDDVVTEQNSRTADTREKLWETFNNHSNLLDEWGLEESIGTRYAPDDVYGRRIAISESDPEIPLRSKRYQCWTVKPGFENVDLRDLQEHMVDLWFPKKLDWKSLRKKLRKSERTFRCQQLNEPVGSDNITFTIEALRSGLGKVGSCPTEGHTFIAWDWALASGKGSDFSSAAVGRVGPDRELYVMEVLYGHFKPSELAYHVVALTKKWNPKTILIERSNGSEFFERELKIQSGRYNVPLPIYWAPTDNRSDAKRNRIKGLETLLAESKLIFFPGPWIDETFTQFTRYTGERKNRGRKDDIPDAIAYLQFFIPLESKAPKAAPLTQDQDLQRQKDEVMALRAAAMGAGLNVFSNNGRPLGLTQMEMRTTNSTNKPPAPVVQVAPPDPRLGLANILPPGLHT